MYRMNPMTFRFVKPVCGFLTVLCFASVFTAYAHAETRHALLVGVNHYDSLPDYLQLKGPANDVELVAGVLQQYGFEKAHMTLLAEGIEAAKKPTRDAILSALEELAAKARPKDFVYLHFSGHGSQQPAPLSETDGAQETDGLDEIFLPADIGKWENAIGRVEQSITDDEIGDAITKIRNRGAFVWAVFDACHSGTMTRGLPLSEEEAERSRKVAPSNLAIPDALLGRPVLTPPPSDGGDAAKARGLPESLGVSEASVAEAMTALASDAGGYVAFFAAQTTETTPEMRLPQGHPQRRTHGLFSFTLMQALAVNPGATYRQLGQYVLQAYAAQNRRYQTPLFEGTALDAHAFGSTPGEQKRQWKIDAQGGSLHIPAGTLHELAPGSVFAIVPSAIAPVEDVLGYARLETAAILQSRLAPFAGEGKPALRPDDLPAGAHARLVHARFTPSLRVALPPASPSPGADEQKLADVLDAIAREMKERKDGIAITWVKAGQEADVRLAIGKSPTGTDAVLWLLPPSGELVTKGPAKTHSIGLGARKEALYEKIETSLVRMAKVFNLLRLSGLLAASPVTEKMALTASVTRAGSGEKETYPPTRTPVFYEGDEVAFEVMNLGATPFDLTVLFVDDAFGITPLFPATPGEINRLEANGRYVLRTEINAETVGLERLLVIAVEAEPNAPTAEFTFLAQESLPRTRGKKDAASPEGRDADVESLFRHAGFNAPLARGLTPKKAASERAGMQMFSWYTERAR